MGGADIIPGVSGGTMALILGIYERLVTAISRLDIALLGHLRCRRWRAAANHIDFGFLVAVLAGIALGVGGLASLMHYLLENHLQHTYAGFFGLILASSVLVARMIDRWPPAAAATALGALVFAYWLVGRLPAEPPPGLLYVFLCGAVAICAMILPGVSGAFILLIMGRYHDITGLLRDMLRFEIDLDGLAALGVFALGALSGLLAFSKFLHWLLAHYHRATIAALCGFMVGSLRRIWPFKEGGDADIDAFVGNVVPDLSVGNSWISIAILLLAGGLVMVLDYVSRRMQARQRPLTRRCE